MPVEATSPITGGMNRTANGFNVKQEFAKTWPNILPD